MSSSTAKDTLRQMWGKLGSTLSANRATTNALAEGLFEQRVIPSATRLEITQSYGGGHQISGILLSAVEAYVGTSDRCGEKGITALVEELKKQGLDDLSTELARKHNKEVQAGSKRKHRHQQTPKEVKHIKNKTKKRRQEDIIPDDSSSDSLSLPQSLSSLSSSSSCVSSLESEAPDTLLEIDDLNTLLQLTDTVSYKWRRIGLQLHLTHAQLETLAADNREKGQDMHLVAVLTNWLRQNYNTQKFGKPTWRMLVQALEVVDDCKPTAESIMKARPWK